MSAQHRFIAVHHQRWPVCAQCRVLGVSASGFYKWRRRGVSKRGAANAELAAAVQRIYDEHGGRYGSPRIHAELRAAAAHCSENRVARLMRQLGLQGKRLRRRWRNNLQAGTRVADQLQRQFAPGGQAALVADITGLRTREGRLYLAVVLCLRTRRVLGWSMSRDEHGALPLEALRSALARYPIHPGTLHHSDGGGHYTSGALALLLGQQQLTASMSRPRNCYDNAVAESFFATLKRELGGLRPWATRCAAQAAVQEYLDGYFNSCRRHSTLGHLTPDAYAVLLTASIPPVD